MPPTPPRPICTRAAILAVGLLFASPVLAQDGDTFFEELEKVISTLYQVDPATPGQDIATLDRLKVERSEDPRLSGALARAYAWLAEQGESAAVDDAYEHGQKAVTLNPMLSVAHYGHGWGLVTKARQGRDLTERQRRTLLEQAVQAFGTAAERARGRGWIDLCAQAMVLRQLGRDKEAAKSYEKALSVNRFAWEPLVEWGHMLAEQGDLEQALEAFARATRKAERSKKMLDQWSRTPVDPLNDELSPGEKRDRRAQLERVERSVSAIEAEAASVALLLGDLDRAATHVEASLARTDVSMSARRVAAELALAKGDAAGALAALDHLESSTPFDHALRAEALRLSDRPEEAKKAVSAAIHVDHPIGRAYTTLAHLELTAKELGNALHAARASAARNRHDPAAWRALANVMTARQNPKQAAAAEERAKSIEAELAEVRQTGRDLQSRVRTRAGIRMIRQHRYHEVLKISESLLAQDEDDGLAAVLKAQALVGLSKEAGLKAAKRAFDLLHDAVDVHLALAAAAQKERESGLAREHALRAVSMQPDNARARTLLARIDRSSVEATEEVQGDVDRLRNTADPTERLQLVQGFADKGKLIVLVLHLSAEDDDDVLAAMITKLGSSSAPEVQRSLESRAASLTEDYPRAQVALVKAVAAYKDPSRTALDALSLVASRPASEEVRTIAKQVLGEQYSGLNLGQRLALMQEVGDPSDPEAEARMRLIDEAHLEQIEKNRTMSLEQILTLVLRYFGAGMLLILIVMWVKRKRSKGRKK